MTFKEVCKQLRTTKAYQIVTLPFYFILIILVRVCACVCDMLFCFLFLFFRMPLSTNIIYQFRELILILLSSQIEFSMFIWIYFHSPFDSLFYCSIDLGMDYWIFHFEIRSRMISNQRREFFFFCWAEWEPYYMKAGPDICRASQMNLLLVTVAEKVFKHLTFHFVKFDFPCEQFLNILKMICMHVSQIIVHLSNGKWIWLLIRIVR